MKKICFITTVSSTLKSFVIDNAKNLYEKKGYDITLICNDDRVFAEQLPEYIKFIPVKMERGVNLKGFSAIFSFIKIFRQNKFDYIQYATPNASLYASIASSLLRCPVRVYAQWGIRYVGLSGLGKKVLKLFEKITCILSTHIRAVSQKNMQFAINEKLCDQGKVKVIGNGGTVGVCLNEFDISQKQALREKAYKKFNISNDTFVFGFVGRLSKDKGSYEMLTAFKSIIEKGYNAKLLIVGDNESSAESNDIIKWAQQSDSVIFAGRYPKSELDMFYAAFDCYVHPTYREGFGMVLQEAGAMGNAIITTNIPGASEVMENGISCVLVPPQNIDELTFAMEEMMRNPDKAILLGQNAYQRTKTLYERSIMLDNILKDIDNILGEKQ